MLLAGVGAFLAGRFVLWRAPAARFPRAATVTVLVSHACVVVLLPFRPPGWEWFELFRLFDLFPAALVYAGLAAGSHARCGRPRGFSLWEWTAPRLYCLPQAPFVVFTILVGLRDLVPAAGLFFARRPVWELGAGIAATAGLVVVLPFGLRYLVPVRPLEGPGAERLHRLARSAGIRLRGVFLWCTGARGILNAFVTGFVPGTRHVFLTDGLLKALSPDEIEAVFAHEISHIRCRHLLVLIVFVLGMLGLVTGGIALAEGVLGGWAYACMVAVLFLFFAGPFAWVSRLLELEADLTALELGADPAAFASALEKLMRCSARRHDRHSWRHYSVPYRVAAVARYAAEPESMGRVRGRTRKVKALAAAVAAAGVCMAGFMVSIPSGDEERVNLAAYLVQRAPLHPSYAPLAESTLRTLLEDLQFARTGALDVGTLLSERMPDGFRAERVRLLGFRLLEKALRLQGKDKAADRAARKAQSIAGGQPQGDGARDPEGFAVEPPDDQAPESFERSAAPAAFTTPRARVVSASVSVRE